MVTTGAKGIRIGIKKSISIPKISITELKTTYLT